MKQLPRYPIYIPSKARAHVALTPKMFDKAGVPYRIVVQPDQVDAYAAWRDRLLVLPENDRGLVYARNWIKDHSISEGHERHWQFDDDIRFMTTVYRGHRLPISSRAALVLAEEFVDRYENVALASFNSEFFVPITYGINQSTTMPPFYLNSRCYTCFLVLNSVPNRWRRRYNEDTDMSLQVLSSGWCTVLFNAYLIVTPETMHQRGGQTDIYEDDGRLRMARQLESQWPGTVTVDRRHSRPQHVIRHNWRRFDTPLKLKPGVAPPSESMFKLKLTTRKPITHPMLKQLIDEQEQENG